jgi:hypothetical protein
MKEGQPPRWSPPGDRPRMSLMRLLTGASKRNPKSMASRGFAFGAPKKTPSDRSP